MIEIKNNGTIENAKTGIHCINATNEEGGSVGSSKLTGGGIVLANNARFTNNSISVVFEKYSQSSASRFKLCTFVINDELYPDETFNYFVRMNEVNGVTYTGCTFKNEKSSFGFDRGKGIYSNNSFFIVDQFTTPPPLPPQKTIFNNLRYGIYAIGQKGGRTFSVANALFDYNESGIYASGTDLVNLKGNVFKMKNSSSLPPVSSGIYLEKCTGYIIEENEFWTIDNNPFLTSYGIYINSSGEANNTIYKNKFFDNKYGIAAQDKNRNKDGSAGLLLKCNEFNNVKMDIAVLKTEPLSTGMGIASTQGTNGINCEYPAGNLFTNPYPPVTGYYSIYNEGGPFVYTHHNMSNNNRVRPSVITESTVTRMPTGLNYAESCCPPHTNGGGGVGIIDGVTLSHKSEAVSTTQTLTTLIDDGDTGGEVMDVNSAAPAEALLIRNNLLQTSPYVSDTVLKTAINREELLNNAMLRDIMVANPHSAKSETIMEELDMRLDPMPEYMKDEILEGVFVLSAKELMEAKRDMDMQLFNYGFSRLLSASLTDTIPVPADTLIALLAADGSVQSFMKQSWILMELGDTTAALYRMETISSENTITVQELAELSEQQIFMQWLAANPVIDSADFETLSNFAESASSTVSAASRSIMIANNLFEYNEPYLVPDLTKSAEISKIKPNSVQKSNETIRAYPNPGKDYITVEYNFGDNQTSGSYEIADQAGKIVKKGNLGRNTDQVIIDTRVLISGNYYINLISGRNNVASTRFIITK